MQQLTTLELVKAAYRLKAEETEIKARRLRVEEYLAAALQVPDQWEGSRTVDIGQYKVKVMQKLNTRIDKDLTTFARANHLEGYLGAIFRWKPEIDKKKWDNAPEQVRAAFSEVVIQTPSKASFTITPIKEEN